MRETLTGSRPVGAFPRLHSIVKTPPALDRIIRRALDPDPDKRHPSIEAFTKALRHSTRWHASWWKPLLVLLLAAIPCILTAKHFLTPPPVPIVREITFPMRIQSGDLRVAKAECQSSRHATQPNPAPMNSLGLSHRPLPQRRRQRPVTQGAWTSRPRVSKPSDSSSDGDA